MPQSVTQRRSRDFARGRVTCALTRRGSPTDIFVDDIVSVLEARMSRMSYFLGIPMLRLLGRPITERGISACRGLPLVL